MKKTQRGWNSTLRARSPKVAERNKKWQGICLNRIAYIEGKYGNAACEYCGGWGSLDSENLFAVWGHHIDGDRNNCTEENCFIAHHFCQTEIHTKHIDVSGMRL